MRFGTLRLVMALLGPLAGTACAGLPVFNGVTTWTRTWGGQDDYRAGVTMPGGDTWVLRHVDTSGSDQGEPQDSLLHFDAAGSLISTTPLVMSAESGFEARALLVDGSGNVFVTGRKYNFVDQMFLAKWSSASFATPAWVSDGYSVPGRHLIGVGLAQDGSGNSYVAVVDNSDSYGNNQRDGRLVKIDAGGTFQWAAAVDFGDEDQALAAAVDGSDDVYVAGTAQTGLNRDAFVRKYNPSGALQWSSTYSAGSTSGGANGSAVTIGPVDGLLYLAAGSDSMRVWRISPADGAELAATVAGGDSTVYIASSIAVDLANDIWVAGTRVSYNAPGWDAIVLDKIDGALFGRAAGFPKFRETALADGGTPGGSDNPLPAVRMSVTLAGGPVLSYGVFPVCGSPGPTGSNIVLERFAPSGASAGVTVADHGSGQSVVGAAAAHDGRVFVGVGDGPRAGVRAFSPAGVLLWERTVSATGFCDLRPRGFAYTPGRVALSLSGMYSGTFSSDAVVVAVWDEDGNNAALLTQPTQAAREWSGLAFDGSGSLYVAASSENCFSCANAIRIVKFSPAGVPQWERAVALGGTGQRQETVRIGAGTAGDLYLAWRHQDESAGGGSEAWAARLDANASLLWSHSAGGAGAIQPQGAAMAAGYWHTFGFAFQEGVFVDGFVVRYDPDGHELWQTRWDSGRSFDALMGGLGADSAGNLFISAAAGNIDFSGGEKPNFDLDYYLVSLAPDGSQRWTRTFDSGNKGDFPGGVAVWPGHLAGRIAVAGADEGGGRLLRWSEPVAELEAEVAAIPASTRVGEWVEIVLTVTNVGTVDAEDVLPSLQFNADGGILTAEAGPVPAGPVTLAPDAQQSFTWTYSVSGAGVATFTATAAGTEADSGVARNASAGAGLAVGAQLFSELFTSVDPATLLGGQTFDVYQLITNAGGVSANAVVPVLQIHGGAVAAVPGSPQPAGPLTILGGLSTTLFTWTLSLTGAGPVDLTFSATGTENGTGRALATGASLAGAWGFGRAVLVPALTLSPGISPGQSLIARLTVSNTGNTTATALIPSLAIAGGASLVSVQGAPAGTPSEILPGGGLTFTWTLTALAEGAVSFTVSVAGYHLGTAEPVGAGSGASVAIESPKYVVALVTIPASPVAGQPFTVRALVNSNSFWSVGNVNPSLQPQADAGGGLVTFTGGPDPDHLDYVYGTQNPVSSTAFGWTYTANSAGAVQLTATVTGTDPQNGQPVVGRATVQFDVRPVDAAVVAGLAIAPAAPATGQVLSLALTVSNTGGADAINMVPEVEITGGTGLVTFGTSPTGGPATIPGGSAQSFVWTYTVTGAGPVAFSVTINGNDGGTFAALSATAYAQAVTVTAAAGLAVRLDRVWPWTATPAGGELITLRLTVSNTGNLAADTFSVTVFAVSGGGLVTLDSGGPPPPASLAPHQVFEVFWSFSSQGAGTVAFTGSATGLEVPSGLPLEAIDGLAVTFRGPAQLSAQLDRYAAARETGLPFLVTLTVTNSGGTDATLVAAAPIVSTGAGSAVPLAGPSPSMPVTVAAGASRNFSWTFTGVVAGSVTLGTTVTGQNFGNGVPLSTGPVISAPVTILAPAFLVCSPSVTPAALAVTQGVRIALTVTNTGQVTADNVTLFGWSFTGSGLLNYVSGPVPASQTLAPGAAVTFVMQFTAAALGTVGLSTTAIGTDQGTGAVVLSGTSFVIPITAGAALNGALTVSPDPVTVGQTLKVDFTVSNTGTNDANAVDPQLQVNAGGLALVSAPSLLSPLAPGAATTFEWTFTVLAAGPVNVTATATGTDAVTSDPLGVTLTRTATAQTPAALSAVAALSRSTVNVGQTLLITMTVSNSGQATATTVGMAPVTPFGTGVLSPVSGPTPSLPASIAGGAGVTLTFTATGSVSGPVWFTVTITAVDANSGAPAGAVSGLSNTVTVQTPAALAAAAAVLSSQISVGQPFLVTVTVTNTGEATAGSIGPVAFTVNGPGGATYAAGPNPALPATLTGGASATFTWTFTGASAGAVTLTTTVDGVDTNTGGPVTTGARTTASAVLVQTPAALEIAAALIPAQLSAGQPFMVTVTVTNTGQAAANGFAISPNAPFLTQTGTGTIFNPAGPTPVVPGTLAGGASQTFTWGYNAQAAGSLGFSVSAFGGDANSGLPVASAYRVTNPGLIQTPAALSVVSALSRSTVNVGQTLLLTLSVSNSGEAQATGVSMDPVNTFGTGVLSPVAGPTPLLPVTIAGGAGVVLSFTATGSVAGPVWFTVTLTAVDANSGANAGTVSEVSNTVTVQTPAALAAGVAVLRPQVSVAQTFMMTLTITNTGGAAATGVDAILPAVNGPGGATYAAGPNPPLPVALTGGQSATFTWTFTGASTGLVTLTTTVSGSDANTLAALSTGQKTSPSAVLVQTPAALAIASALFPAQLSEGQPFTVTISVTNTGEAGLTGFAVSPGSPLLTQTGTGAVFNPVGPSPAIPATLAGGAGQSFTWTYNALAAGTLGFSASAFGADANSGAAVASAYRVTAAGVIQTPAALSAVPSITRTTVDIGQSFQVTLSVSNSGQATAGTIALSAFAPSVAGILSGLTGPFPAMPATLAGGAGVVLTWTVTGATSGTVTFSATLTALDANSGANAGTTSGASNPVTVQTPAALSAKVMGVYPRQVSVGQDFVVTLTVTNSGEGAANAVTPPVPFAAGSGVATLSAGPFPVSATVLIGAPRTFTWTFTGGAPGTLILSNTPAGTNANTGATVSDVGGSGVITVQTPAQLTATLYVAPSPRNTSQTFVLSLAIGNNGQASATTMLVSVPAQTPAVLATLSASPTGIPVALTGGQYRLFTWTYTGNTAGTVSFSLTIFGSDVNSGLPTTLVVGSGAETLQAPAGLDAAVTVSTTTITIGQTFMVMVTVTNTGGATMNNINAAAFVKTGGGNATQTAGPNPALPASLAGGASQTFTWTFTGTIQGGLVESTAVGGLDANSGTILGPLAKSSPIVVVQTPANLTSSSLAVIGQSTINVGQKFYTQLTLINSGDADAVSLSITQPIFSSGSGAITLAPGNTAPLPTVVPGHGVVTYTWTYTGASSGSVYTQASAAGFDANSAAAVATGTKVSSNAVVIQTPAVLVATLTPPVSNINQGQPATLTLTVNNTGEATAAGVTAAALTGSLPAGIMTAGASDTGPLAIPGGGSHAFSWTYNSTLSGTFFLGAGAGGADANTGAALTVTPANNATVFIAPAAVLTASTFVAPASVKGGEVFQVRFEVANSGGTTATVYAATLPIDASLVELTAGPSPAVPLSLLAGQHVTFVWTLKARKSGTLPLVATAQGWNWGDGSVLTAQMTGSVGIEVGVTVAQGKLIAAPNLYDAAVPGSDIVFFGRGTPGGTTELRIYDSGGNYVGSVSLPLDSTGVGSIALTGAKLDGKPLATGVYWILPTGGGVSGKKPFMVRGRK